MAKQEFTFPKGVSIEEINIDVKSNLLTVVYGEEKPALEVGKWISDLNDTVNVLIVSHDKDTDAFNGVGINNEGNWGTWTDIMFDNKPSDMKEVKKLLIQEAEKRGFEEGVRFITISRDPCEREFCGNFNLTDMSLCDSDTSFMLFKFETGKWAEIIEEKKEEKPPIGIMPNSIWIEYRKTELIEAIHRYNRANIEVPVEWVSELASYSPKK